MCKCVSKAKSLFALNRHLYYTKLNNAKLYRFCKKGPYPGGRKDVACTQMSTVRRLDFDFTDFTSDSHEATGAVSCQ